MKIVINDCYGSFDLSEFGWNELPKEKRDKFKYSYDAKWYRADKYLISILEKYGSDKISGDYSHLCIIEIPSGTAYRICEYDGAEYVEYRDEIDWEIATQ